MPGYHRRNLGGGNSLKAVTRTRRAAARHALGVTSAQVKQRNRIRYVADLLARQSA